MDGSIVMIIIFLVSVRLVLIDWLPKKKKQVEFEAKWGVLKVGGE